MTKDFDSRIVEVASCLRGKIHVYVGMIANAANDLCKDECQEFRNAQSPPFDVSFLSGLRAAERCAEGLYVLSLTATTFAPIALFDCVATVLVSIQASLKDLSDIVCRNSNNSNYQLLYGKIRKIREQLKGLVKLMECVSSRKRLSAEQVEWLRKADGCQLEPSFPYDASAAGEEPNVARAVISGKFSIVGSDAVSTTHELSLALGYGETYIKNLKHIHCPNTNNGKVGKNVARVPFPGFVGKRGRRRTYRTVEMLNWLEAINKIDAIKQHLGNGD